MDFELISFEDFKSLIHEILDYKPQEDYNLTPNEIFCVLEETGIILEGVRIPGWEDFETGVKGFSTQELLSRTKIDLETQEPVVIISDECFKKQKAYKVPSEKLIEFAESTYPSIHDMDFVQPLDLIIIQPSSKTISMIHHEGLIMDYWMKKASDKTYRALIRAIAKMFTMQNDNLDTPKYYWKIDRLADG